MKRILILRDSDDKKNHLKKIEFFTCMTTDFQKKI